MSCIVNLLEAFEKEQKVGTANEDKTLAFFTKLLEQLRCIKKDEIKTTLKLLSSANTVKPAKTLYYFTEENAKCTLYDKYLKRICGMSHTDTLELAKLCGVNVLPYHVDATFKKEKYTKTLKDFYLQRFPFIVLKESRERNENPSTILKNLCNKICSIELFECQEIRVKYPFGDDMKERIHFDGLKIYVVGDWINQSSRIHKYIKEKLCLKADIDDVIDMQTLSQDLWIECESQNFEIFYKIEKEIQSLLSSRESKIVDVGQPIQYNIDGDCARNSSTKVDSAETKIQEELLEQKVLDEILSDLKLKKNVVNPVTQNSKNESLYEETTSDSTQKVLLQPENREASVLEPPDFKFKESISNLFPQNSNTVMVPEQAICSSTVKESLGQESERNVKKKFLDYKASKVESPLVCTNPIQRQTVCDNNSLTRFTRKENFNPHVYTPQTNKDLIYPGLEEFHNISMQEPNKIDNMKGGNFNKECKKTSDEQQPSSSKANNNVVNPLFEEIDDDSELEICNDLKEFYLKRLSLISVRESKSLKKHPFIILKRLYDKVISIELINGNNDPKKVVRNKSVSENCYFASLKIYAPGKWTNYETEIHQHLIQELCINSNIEDILDMKTITENSKEEWVRINDENLVTFNLLEEALRRLLQVSSHHETIVSQETKDNDKNTDRPDKFGKNCKKKSSKKSDRRRPAINRSVSKREVRVNKSHLQRFHENYVFTFLKKHYVRKHPNARYGLMFNEYFLLEWKSHRISIHWINESEDHKVLFDIMVKKDDKIFKAIKVQSVNSEGELFNVNHSMFLKLRENIAFLEPFMSRTSFRIYCVVNAKESTSTDGIINEPLALYKIVPLKLPSI